MNIKNEYPLPVGTGIFDTRMLTVKYLFFLNIFVNTRGDEKNRRVPA